MRPGSLHPMNTDYYTRIRGILDPEAILKARAAIVGIGSGGGFIAEELGRLGLRLLLVDRPDERLETHNIVRHVLGMDALGRPKHAALAEHLKRVNPDAEVIPLGMDVAKDTDALASAIQSFEPDLIVSATDNQAARYATDRIARNLGVPVVGGGVYDGGVGGEIYLSEPPHACYGCISLKIRGRRMTPDTAKAEDYSNPNLPEHPTTIALRTDIAQIASFCTRFVLKRLFSPDVEAFGIPEGVNLAIFSNRRIAGVFEQSLAARFFKVEPHSSCMVCQPMEVLRSRDPSDLDLPPIVDEQPEGGVS